MDALHRVFLKARVAAVDTNHERLRRGTRRATKQRLAPPSRVNQAVIGELLMIGFHRAIRADREREIVDAEHAAGVYYCRRCGELCEDGVCPEHGRQYGMRGA